MPQTPAAPVTVHDYTGRHLPGLRRRDPYSSTWYAETVDSALDSVRRSYGNVVDVATDDGRTLIYRAGDVTGDAVCSIIPPA